MCGAYDISCIVSVETWMWRLIFNNILVGVLLSLKYLHLIRTSHFYKSNWYSISIRYLNICCGIFCQWRYEPSQTSIFQDLTFLHILKGYALIYQLSKFQEVILLNFWIKADSNLERTVLSPLEMHRSVLNHAPRACAEVVSARCSHRRAYKSNTLNAYRIVINQSRSSICGGFTLRALGKQRFEPS